MLKNKLIKVLLSSLLVSSTLYANSNVAENIEIDADQNKISSADMDKDVIVENIEDWVSSFENDMGVTIGLAQKGRTFFSGSAVVNVNQLNSAYAKELTIAYEKALLDLQSNFILQTYGTMSTERILDTMSDDSTNANQFDRKEIEDAKKNMKSLKDKVSLIDKGLELIASTSGLDRLLTGQGSATSLIQDLTINQKKQLYKDNFKKEMIKKAVQNISGLVPIQTKVVSSQTDAGMATEIGIIAVMSEKTVQFAQDISKSRPTLVKGKPKRISDILPRSKKEYLNEFGLRYVYDEEGRPMLLSYGRWSVLKKSKNASKALKATKRAQSKARMFAESYIGEFMKTNIQVSEGATAESVSEEIASKMTKINSDGEEIASNESLDEITETIDKSFKKVRAKSNFKLRGTSKIKTWKQKDENGILHVGTVVAWTYSQLENANNIASKKFKTKKELKKINNSMKKEAKVSRVVNDVSDF